MDPEALRRLFSLTYRATTSNLEGIGEEAALRTHAGGANAVNWMLGHLVASRGAVLRAVGAEPVWDEETAASYSGHETADWRAEAALPLDRIRADYDESQTRLMAGLERMGPEDLAKPLGKRTVGDALAFHQFHEAYHAGQVGLGRRLLGLPGVIKPPKRG